MESLVGGTHLHIMRSITHCSAMLLSIHVLLGASAGLEAKELSTGFIRKALVALKSSDPGKRKAAYRAFQTLGDEGLDGYKRVLQQAQHHHQEALRRALAVRGNPYADHLRVAEELEAERERVMGLIHTDWEKNPGRIKQLANEIEGVERKYKKQLRLLKSRTEGIDRNVNASLKALVEMKWELTSIERNEEGENTGNAPDMKEIEEAVYEDSFEAGEWKEMKEEWDAARLSVGILAEAKKHNANCKWGTKAQKDFSDHLNARRVIMGLRPMLLEERLSDASRGHSEDMRGMGFFSHTSPVPGKTSPADRARVARFQGSWTGENIFMGSSSYMSAYTGWFGSDGHRFIMFTKGGSNVIGVGIAGGHWTMMTGRK